MAEVSSTVPAEGGSVLPPEVAAAWGVREHARRGPKPGLSVGRIVDAAVRVADAEGLDAVSMGRVAAELGSAPMSLYRHVAGKDQLVELMVDAAWGQPPAAPEPADGWRAGLSRWAWTLRGRGYQHSWVVRATISGPPIMPNQVAWFHNGLQCMRDTGLPESRKASVLMLLGGFVRNLVGIDADMAAAIKDAGVTPLEWLSRYGAMLRELADTQRFPALGPFIEAGVFDVDDGPDDEFIFGLDRILDGIEVLISRR